ncbi:MAG: ABC transporter permease [Thermoplasmata archaeon]|nr:MAG: ABC transporter permease [Candidatus Acetothermia bacterium]RLF63615.1 MAG: ABC transporter permease [Thermoplasmata archaeon]
MTIFLKLIKNPLGLIGLALLVFFAVIGILAPVLAPPAWENEPYRIPRDGYSPVPKPPSSEHPFGTAEGQYDIYYGIIWGTRTAWKVSLVVVSISALIGIVIGSIAAFYGGIVDEVLMRITDIFYAFPFLVGAMVLTTILGRGLTNVMIALIALGWMGYARLIRGDILQIREADYVQAARAVGANSLRIIVRHILPNAIWPVVVQGTMNMGSIVITAAALSFLGVGAPVGYADWGQLISYARNWIIGLYGNPLAYWYVVVYPSIAITLFCLSWNLVGDALRDILDPRLRGSR